MNNAALVATLPNAVGSRPLTVSLARTARLLGVHRATLDSIINKDATFPPRVRVGKREHVTFAALEAWIARKAQVAQGEAAA